ncbi:MAG: serine/threonine-protein kinase [Planctomycetota bacterium]
MATSDVDLQHIEVLWARFKERLSSDPLARIEEFALEYPETAEEILRVFPVMQELETVADAEDVIPEYIGPYPVINRIGIGGMGVVYAAQCDALRERIAIKVVSSERLDGKNILRFEQEARAVAALHHTNIVPIYEFAKLDHQHYYTMRLIDGPNLADVIALSDVQHRSSFDDYHETEIRALRLLNRLRGNWRMIAQLGAQAASALEHAHSKEILHRDIKPANLLVDSSDKLWVTDFGLAKRILDENDLTSIFQTVGTPRYMAPEQAKGVADHRSDVYSLGLTLFELLMLGPEAKVYKHRGVETPPNPRSLNPEVPAELSAIVHKSVQSNPADRYQSIRHMLNDLERFAEDYRPARPKSRSKRWMMGTGLAVAAACISLFAFLPSEAGSPALPTKFHVNEGQPFGESVRQLLGRESGFQLTGPDAKHFSFDANKRQLQMVRAADFEVPLDADMDNCYELALRKSGPDALAYEIEVQVEDVNEAPHLDEYAFEEDGKTIHLRGKQLSQAWMLDVLDDRSRVFDGLYFSLTPGVDSDWIKMTPQGVFVFDPAIAQSRKLDSDRNGVFDLELTIEDETDPWMLRLEQRSTGAIALVKERIVPGPTLDTVELSENCLIRRDVIDIATSDGQNVFHIHPNGKAGITLFRSSIGENGTLESVQLSEDCGLPPETIGIATHNGTEFAVLARVRGEPNKTILLAGHLQEGGKFKVQTLLPSSGIPASVDGFAWLDDSRFHHIRTDNPGQAKLYFSFLTNRFANMPLKENGSEFANQIRGQAAWKQQTATSEAIRKQIRIDTNARERIQ